MTRQMRPRRARRRSNQGPSGTWRRAAVALTGVSLALSACGTQEASGGFDEDSDPVRGGDLAVSLTAIPTALDPYSETNQGSWLPARNVCEPLFDVDADNSVQPVLVSDYELDGTDFVMTLREGVQFHDGSPLTAEDVVANIERFRQTPGNGQVLDALVASVSATGDLEVTLGLNQPSPIIPALLVTAFIMPGSVQQDRPTTEPANDLICTGPYRLTTFTPDREVRLERWDDYSARDEEGSGATGRKNAYVDSITFTALADNSARREGVLSGQLDVAPYLSLDDLSLLDGAAGARGVLTSTIAPTVVFNKAAGVMADQRMRQAVLAALDMSEIMTAAYGNEDAFNLDGGIAPEASALWHTDAGTEAYNAPDPDRVRELLEEAGYDGSPIVWLTTREIVNMYAPSMPARQQLEDAGLNIDLQVLDLATVNEYRTDPERFDMFSSTLPAYADPLLIPYLGDWFPGDWVSAPKTELVTELGTTTDEERRQEIWAELQQLIYEEVPFVKFGDARILVGATNRTHAQHDSDLVTGLYYNVWLDE